MAPITNVVAVELKVACAVVPTMRSVPSTLILDPVPAKLVLPNTVVLLVVKVTPGLIPNLALLLIVNVVRLDAGVGIFTLLASTTESVVFETVKKLMFSVALLLNICLVVPLNATALLLQLKVPLVLVKLPDTFRSPPEVPGSVMDPPLISTLPAVVEEVPLPPVMVPAPKTRVPPIVHAPELRVMVLPVLFIVKSHTEMAPKVAASASF